MELPVDKDQLGLCFDINEIANDEHTVHLVESEHFHCDIDGHDHCIEADKEHAPLAGEKIVVHRNEYHGRDEKCEKPH